MNELANFTLVEPKKIDILANLCDLRASYRKTNPTIGI